ncbi:hypothetical protein Egran_05451 [Elaphomyces granulatus]|uniref:F-box domain-containing protein n=1 Tax=Elaphomyces granulatus TaxID=519963 RepID=A0A232LRM7_9EURO|nr:hypothetical protein Egran_05451 [Elaphomyces granulatus]
MVELLDLPTELIQLVLQSASTPSFLQAAVCCRTLFRIASTSREVILHHLDQVPGYAQEFKPLATKQLFGLLRRRAEKQLYGANFNTNRELYCFAGQTIDAGASSIATSGNPNTALVLKGDDTVRLFHTENGSVTQEGLLIFPYEQPGTAEILHSTFSGEDEGIFVLFRFTPEAAEKEEQEEGDDDDDDDNGDIDMSHPFVKHAAESNPSSDTLVLVHYDFSTQAIISIFRFPDCNHLEPIALAAASRDTFAIYWCDLEFQDDYDVILYQVSHSALDDDALNLAFYYPKYKSTPIEEIDVTRMRQLQDRLGGGAGAHEQPPITHISFNDGAQLLYHFRAHTIYQCYQDIRLTTEFGKLALGSLHSNRCRVEFSDSLGLFFSIAIPFFGTHETRASGQHHSTCHWKYLSVGVATHQEENWTVACLLMSQAVCQAANCGHILNLDRGRRLNNWTIVARLWGYRTPSNSLGCIVAAAKNGTRIAIANWNVLYIWTLDPDVLIENNASGFYPASWKASDSEAIELRPIVLRLDAVCFKMRFTENENELLTLTDRGLMYWNLDPRGTGARIVSNL